MNLKSPIFSKHFQNSFYKNHKFKLYIWKILRIIISFNPPPDPEPFSLRWQCQRVSGFVKLWLRLERVDNWDQKGSSTLTGKDRHLRLKPLVAIWGLNWCSKGLPIWGWKWSLSEDGKGCLRLKRNVIWGWNWSSFESRKGHQLKSKRTVNWGWKGS